MDNQGDKIKLFGSDDEEEENYDDFKIRPQFQGPHGQKLFELSSRLPERFKLDERFAEVFEPEYQQDAEAEAVDEGKEEREKNIKILESVLGHEVCPQTADKSKKIKKQIRFDPDNENALHLVKKPETAFEKPKKSKKKKAALIERIEQPIPISNERYIEVCPNLKEILNTASPFSFSQQFNNDVEKVENSHETYEESCEPEENSMNSKKFYEPVEDFYKPVEETEIQSFQKNENLRQLEKLNPKHVMPKSTFLFFVSEGDPRLKEGVQFFKRPKPIEEIRMEWNTRRQRILELFRSKKKSHKRKWSRSTRVQSMQNKFAVRNNKFAVQNFLK